MPTASYSSTLSAAARTPLTLDEALVDVADLAYKLTAYPAGLAAFAYSQDAIDHAGPEHFRSAIRILALRCARWLTAAEQAVVTWALDHVFGGDEWASKELVGKRWASALERASLLAALERHPRIERFTRLCEDVLRGRATPAQMGLARKLAAEVTS